MFEGMREDPANPCLKIETWGTRREAISTGRSVRTCERCCRSFGVPFSVTSLQLSVEIEVFAWIKLK